MVPSIWLASLQTISVRHAVLKTPNPRRRLPDMATKTTKRPRSGIDELARRLKAIETRLSSLEANPKRPGKLRLGKSARQVVSDIARERSGLAGLAASPFPRERKSVVVGRSG